MNPKTITAGQWTVQRTVKEFLRDWPTADVTFGHDRLSAVAIVHDPQVTYILEVTPESVRSLWVSHRAPIAEGYVPEWTDGWVD